MDIDTVGAYSNYGNLVRPLNVSKGNLQHRVLGKIVISYNQSNTNSTWLDDSGEYEAFISGYDDDGNEQLHKCNDEAVKFLVPTYFKKEVLDKYYNNPQEYNVDGFTLKGRHFTLKIDNNVEDYVPVFIHYLTEIPHKEQLHWKQYNFMPNNAHISKTYHNTMVLGNWAEEPGTVDLYFKSKYRNFNKMWEEKFGWPLYLPLTGTNIHLFTSLHLPTKNNIKSFSEQMLTIVKLTIDALNESKLSEGLNKIEKERGLGKFERFLGDLELPMPDMFEFLRYLQDLRSGMIAHRFSNSNKNVKKAIKFFGLNEENYREVAKDIFVKSIFTLNSLEKHLLAEPK